MKFRRVQANKGMQPKRAKGQHWATRTKMCAPLRCWCFVQIGNFLKITYFHAFPGSLARNSPCIWSGLVFAGRTQHHGLFVAKRQPHALNCTANISDSGLAAEEIAVPLRCGGTTSREGLPIRNQSYGTWKGPRQILMHYETAQPRKAELLFSAMLSVPSQCWAPERFPRLRNTFASQRH